MQVDHAEDLQVECQESDPNVSGKNDGTYELISPYEGADDK